MPYDAGTLLIERAADIRRKLNIENLERERDFWMKKAEQLHDDLQYIFDAAEKEGKITLTHRDKTVVLLLERS
jgi:hypothetical protein